MPRAPAGRRPRDKNRGAAFLISVERGQGAGGELVHFQSSRWLPRAPADFRQPCREIGSSDKGSRIRQLAPILSWVRRCAHALARAMRGAVTGRLRPQFGRTVAPHTLSSTLPWDTREHRRR